MHAMTTYVGYLHTPGTAPARQILRKQAMPSADAVGFLHVGRGQPVRHDITFDRPGDQGELIEVEQHGS